MSIGSAIDEPEIRQRLELLARTRPDLHATIEFVSERVPAGAIRRVAALHGDATICMATHGRG